MTISKYNLIFSLTGKLHCFRGIRSTVFGVVADIIDLSGAVLAWSFTSLTLSLLGLLIRERGSVTVTVNLSQEAAQGAAHS